jgi:hypothetical protein
MPRVPEPRQTIGLAPLNTPSPAPVVGQPGMRELAQGIQQVGRAGANILEEERRKADEAFLSDAYAQLGRRRLDIEELVRQQRGLDAVLQQPEAFTSELDKEAERISKGLPEPVRERLAGRLQEIQRREQLALSVASSEHFLRERNRYADESDAAKLSQAVRGYDLPAIDAVLNRRAELLGWSPETKTEVRLKETTAMHLRKVDEYSSVAGGPAVALKYLDDNAREIDPDASQKVRERLRTHGREEMATIAADEAAMKARSPVNARDFDLGAAQAAIDARFRGADGRIVDPLTWRTARALVEDQYQQGQKAIQAGNVEAFNKALSEFLTTRRVASIDPETWRHLTDPANKGVEFANHFREWERQDRSRLREERLKPTDAQVAWAGELLTDLNARWEWWKTQDYATFLARANPPVQEGQDRRISLEQLVQLQGVFASIHGKAPDRDPEMDYSKFVMGEIAARYAPRTSQDPNNPATWSPVPAGIFERVVGKLRDEAARRRQRGEKLDQATVERLTRDELVFGHEAGTGIGSGKVGVGLGAQDTTSGKAALEGRIFIPEKVEGIPDGDLEGIKRALEKQGRPATIDNIRAMWRRAHPAESGSR